MSRHGRHVTHLDRRRFMARSAAAATALSVAPAVAEAKPSIATLSPSSVEVEASPIVDFSRTSSKKRFGPLTFRGGLVLKSGFDWFGGWSGLTMSPDGRRLLAISDAGLWMFADLAYSSDKPAGLRNVRIGPLLGNDGAPLRRDRDRDSEGVCLIDGTLDRGTVLVCFEQNIRIIRYPIIGRALGRPQGALVMPPETRLMNRNRAFEAVTMLRGGRYRGAVIAFAERLLDADHRHTGWIWLDGKPEPLHLTAAAGFDVTDATALPDGGLVVLERAFGWLTGVAMRLRRIPAAEIGPGAVLQGEVLLEADMTSEVDNMEALGLHETPQGELVLTIMSDDNFNSVLQRNLLLQFTLDGVRAARA